MIVPPAAAPRFQHIQHCQVVGFVPLSLLCAINRRSVIVTFVSPCGRLQRLAAVRPQRPSRRRADGRQEGVAAEAQLFRVGVRAVLRVSGDGARRPQAGRHPLPRRRDDVSENYYYYCYCHRKNWDPTEVHLAASSLELGGYHNFFETS